MLGGDASMVGEQFLPSASQTEVGAAANHRAGFCRWAGMSPTAVRGLREVVVLRAGCGRCVA